MDWGFSPGLRVPLDFENSDYGMLEDRRWWRFAGFDPDEFCEEIDLSDFDTD